MRPTMEDVAARAGVSRALVSLVMRNSPKVSDARRAAVLRAAEELGYQPHVMARSLASRTSTVLGVMVNDLRNAFFADVVEGLDAAAQAAGFDLDPQHRRPQSRARGERPAQPAFLPAGGGHPALAGRARVGHRSRRPAVPGGAGVPDVASVRCGHRERRRRGGVGAGRRPPRGPRAPAHRAPRRRRRGRGGPASSRVPGGDAAARPRADRRAQRAHRHRAARSPCGSCWRRIRAPSCRRVWWRATTSTPSGRSRLSRKQGCACREDVSVVGYDNTSLAALRHLSLTTVDQPRTEMGRLAFEALIERVRG